MIRSLLLCAWICLAVAARLPASPSFEMSGPALVRSWHRQYFHREPEPRTVAAWSYLFRLGNSREAVLAAMLSTDEYYFRAGQTPDGLIAALFDDSASDRVSAETRKAWLARARTLDRRDLVARFLRAHPEAIQPATVASPLLSGERRPNTSTASTRPLSSRNRSPRRLSEKTVGKTAGSPQQTTRSLP